MSTNERNDEQSMEWTGEQWERFTVRLAGVLKDRFGEGTLLPIDDRTLFAYRSGATERYVSVDDTDEPPREDEQGAYYDALVSPSRDFEPDRTETIRIHL